MARAGAVISLGKGGRGLGAIVPAAARRLAELLHDAANCGDGGVMRATGRDGKSPLIILVSPLPRGLVFSGSGHALVTLRSAADDPSFSAQTLCGLFGLSRAQAEIALAIFNGRAPEEIAAERGVAISTLRTHLAEIFARTGAENQRDLIRLLGMLPPVRSGAIGNQ